MPEGFRAKTTKSHRFDETSIRKSHVSLFTTTVIARLSLKTRYHTLLNPRYCSIKDQIIKQRTTGLKKFKSNPPSEHIYLMNFKKLILMIVMKVLKISTLCGKTQISEEKLT